MQIKGKEIKMNEWERNRREVMKKNWKNREKTREEQDYC